MFWTHDRSNIEAHYDLSNELFKTFLDVDYMLYSCGIFQTDTGRCERRLTGLSNTLSLSLWRERSREECLQRNLRFFLEKG